MSTITNLDASAARAMFPNVVGSILAAELHSGFAILDMGPRAFGVMVRGEFVACCPTYRHAKRAGEKAANRAAACDAALYNDACAVCSSDQS